MRHEPGWQGGATFSNRWIGSANDRSDYMAYRIVPRLTTSPVVSVRGIGGQVDAYCHVGSSNRAQKRSRSRRRPGRRRLR